MDDTITIYQVSDFLKKDVRRIDTRLNGILFSGYNVSIESKFVLCDPIRIDDFKHAIMNVEKELGERKYHIENETGKKFYAEFTHFVYERFDAGNKFEFRFSCLLSELRS